MKVLVTGGAGFIGSYLVTKLQKKNYQVAVLTRSKPKDLPSGNYIIGDITDRKAMLKLIPQFQVVYHLAGLLGTSELIKQAYEASRVNILGTVNILDGALKNQTKVVYITKPNCWLNTYSITKHTAESFTKMYFKEFGLPAVSIKWFNVYGPNQSFHCQKAVPFFIRWALKNEPLQIWGNGGQTMDLIYATDAVEATIAIAEHSQLEGTTVDVGSGIETSVNDLAKTTIKLCRSKSEIQHLPMRPGEIENTHLCADTTVMQKLKLMCDCDLISGLKKTIAWYREELLK